MQDYCNFYCFKINFFLMPNELGSSPCLVLILCVLLNVFMLSTTNSNMSSKNSLKNKNIKLVSRLLRLLISALCTLH
jgi:hypothetical protein